MTRDETADSQGPDPSHVARLAAIVESSDDAIYSWSRDGRITSWNRGAIELFGYRHDEILGRTFDVLLPPDRMPEAASRLDRVRAGERIDTFESARVRKDGSLVEVSIAISTVRDQAGEVVGGATIARDITALRRADEALRESERRLAEAQRTAHLGSWEWDIAADRVTWSDELCNLFGVDPANFVATYQEYLDRVHPEDRELVRSAIGVAFATGEEFGFDHRLVRPDGVVAWLHSRGQVGIGAKGTPERMYGTASEITDRMALEVELAEARDTALESSRLKSEFLATMSHEIRTPMNGVIGLTGLLLDTELTETQRQYAEGVRGSGEALLAIINDILDFSKIEAGKVELEMVDFDLAQAMNEVAALVAEPARAKGLKLLVDCCPVSTFVRGDVGRLRQILLNLLSNAVKFTSAGEVVLQARLRNEADPSRVAVHLEVADTGIGIAPATVGRLFEPFSQADASTTRRYGGTGLGLAICRRLAEAMGGSIGVDSQVDHGSRFWLDLPLEWATQPEPTPAQLSELHDTLVRTVAWEHVPAGRSATSKQPVPSKRRLLIVEDNAINQAVAKGMAARLGYSCDVAANGVEALEALERRHYDALLMDCQMPVMDGFAATAEIRRREAGTNPVPIIAMTAGAMVEDRERCISSGMNDYLAKPVKLLELDGALHRWLRPTEPAPSPADQNRANAS